MAYTRFVRAGYEHDSIDWGHGFIGPAALVFRKIALPQTPNLKPGWCEDAGDDAERLQHHARTLSTVDAKERVTTYWFESTQEVPDACAFLR